MTTSQMRGPSVKRDISSIKAYWDAHPLGRQYVKDETIEPGSAEFFAHIRPWMSFYKFPWIKGRLEREAASLRDKHLLEIGCGMGFDSVEFMRRGVKVTATDLTPTAVMLAKQHFEVEDLEPVDVRVENVRDLSFPDQCFDAVWARGVLHATGDTREALAEIHRVLKPGGRAIISHFYRRPSWMYWISLFGRENIEFKEEDPPVNDFLTEKEVLDMFQEFHVVETAREHYRALPVARNGLKAFLYSWIFRPIYNLIPRPLAERLAYKFSVTAVKE
jgi:ubiquinone/menaquinone biosynthesis C-methylase UbiE